MLIEIYGVGKWTVDMFSIFSMRRPNILPIADLGVQRGVLRWFLSLHLPSYKVTLFPDEVKSPEDEKAGTALTPKTKAKGRGRKAKANVEEDSLPIFGEASPEGVAEDVSSVPPGPASASLIQDGNGGAENYAPVDIAAMPTFTPSINKTLNQQVSKPPPPLPAGLTVTNLKSRLDPKKRGKKGTIFTPQEMEDLTEPWKPYRSLAVCYMWALAEVK